MNKFSEIWHLIKDWNSAVMAEAEGRKLIEERQRTHALEAKALNSLETVFSQGLSVLRNSQGTILSFQVEVLKECRQYIDDIQDKLECECIELDIRDNIILYEVKSKEEII